jgi:hypothetical protein
MQPGRQNLKQGIVFVQIDGCWLPQPAPMHDDVLDNDMISVVENPLDVDLKLRKSKRSAALLTTVVCTELPAFENCAVHWQLHKHSCQTEQSF